MQPFARSSTLGTVYTAAQVMAMLTAPAAESRWIFDRLNAQGVQIGDLTGYVDLQKNPPVITHDAYAAQQRTITLDIRPSSGLVPMTEIVRAHYQLRASDGGWLDWVLGTFTTVFPERIITPGETWWRVIGVDYSQFLADSQFLNASAALVGEDYLAAVRQVAQQYGGTLPLSFLIVAPGKNIPATLPWPTGKTRLSAVNDLLTALSYQALWWDELGRGRSAPLPDYTITPASYVFDTTRGASIVGGTMNDRPDTARSVNIVRVDGEDIRRQPFSATYTNNRPDSPTSVGRTHPKMAVIKDSKIVDYAAAYARARAEVQASSRIFSVLEIATYPWPLSQHLDVYGLVYNTKDEGPQQLTLLESKWIHRCQNGASSLHYLERIVPS